MVQSTIASRGQATLPKAVRDALGVAAGDRVRYVIAEGGVRILPVRLLARLFGALRYDGRPATPGDMEYAVAEGACEEDRARYQRPGPLPGERRCGTGCGRARPAGGADGAATDTRSLV